MGEQVLTVGALVAAQDGAVYDLSELGAGDATGGAASQGADDGVGNASN